KAGDRGNAVVGRQDYQGSREPYLTVQMVQKVANNPVQPYVDVFDLFAVRPVSVSHQIGCRETDGEQVRELIRPERLALQSGRGKVSEVFGSKWSILERLVEFFTRFFRIPGNSEREMSPKRRALYFRGDRLGKVIRFSIKSAVPCLAEGFVRPALGVESVHPPGQVPEVIVAGDQSSRGSIEPVGSVGFLAAWQDRRPVFQRQC